MIEKLVKEFEKIHSSLTKSKKLILADIDKIDEKYRKLAQEEKKSLNESLGILNDQLKYYEKMLGKSIVTIDEEPDDDLPAGETALGDSVKVEEEPVIEDTIFPDNNEESKKHDGADDLPFTETPVEEPVAEEAPVEEKKDEYSDIWPEENAEQEKVEGDEDGWPAFPEEWK